MMMRINTSLIGFAVAVYASVVSGQSFQYYRNLANFSPGSGCVPPGYYQATDQGQVNRQTLISRCEAYCSQDPSCVAFVAQQQDPGNGNTPTGQCFFYRQVPASPARCAQPPSGLYGEAKADLTDCLSSSITVASSYCSSYLGIPVATSTTTATPLAVTFSSTSTLRSSSTTTVSFTSTASTSTSTILSTITSSTATTLVITSTISTTTTAVPLKRRAAVRVPASPAPACLSSASPPASVISSACSRLSVRTSSTTAIVTASTPRTTTTTLTTSSTLSTLSTAVKTSTPVVSATSLTTTTAISTTSTTTTTTATSVTTLTGTGLAYAVYTAPAGLPQDATDYDAAFEPALVKQQPPGATDVPPSLATGITQTGYNHWYRTNYPNIFNTLWPQDDEAFVVNIRGYLYTPPGQTGSYTLTLQYYQDDITFCWIGQKAYSGWSRSNADLSFSIRDPEDTRSFTFEVTKSGYTAFRCVNGNKDDEDYINIGLQDKNGLDVIAGLRRLDDSASTYSRTSPSVFLNGNTALDANTPAFPPFGAET